MNRLICVFVLFYSLVLINGENLKCSTTIKPLITMDCSHMNLSNAMQSLNHLKDHGLVKKLILSHNKLDSSVSFQSWTSLIALDVSYNNLNEITNNTIGPLAHLKELNLSYNNIRMITSNAFDNLTVLEILDLSGNPLLGSNIDMLKGALAGPLFRSLKKFTFTSSSLSGLPVDFFEDAVELQYLDLSDDNISVIPILPPNLVYFKANNNSLKAISIYSFHKSDRIKDLYIENNVNLSEVYDDSFETMYDLRNLSLKGSKSLVHLPAHVFYFNKNLQYLSLTDCGMTSLPHSFKSYFMKIPTVELQGNPWVCNISIKWFILLDPTIYENLRCAVPGNHSLTDFYGPTIRHAVLRNLLYGLLCIVLILFGLAIYISFTMEKRRREDMSYQPLDKTPFQNGVYFTTVV